MTSVVILNKREISTRRRAVLARVRLTEDELVSRAETYELSAEEAGALDELRRLDWLVGSE